MIKVLAFFLFASNLYAGPRDEDIQYLMESMEVLRRSNEVLRQKIDRLEKNVVKCGVDVFIKSGDKEYWLVTLNQHAGIDWRVESVPIELLGRKPQNYKRNWSILCR